jgi:hypothetical protein
MTDTKNDDHKNFIEAKMIIQEFHDDPTVFVVGTAPFGKLWFDQEKVTKQYKVLTDSWYEEYGDNETKHSKRPRIVSVLIDESDPMFNKYRNNIREAQEETNEKQENKIELSDKTPENVVIQSEPSPETKVEEKPKKKRTYKKKEKEPAPDAESSIEKAFQKKTEPKKKKSNTKSSD